MSHDLKHNISQSSTWKRGLFMLLFTLFYGLAEVVLVAVILFQFFMKLFTGDTNERLRALGQNLSTYIYQILQYLNFNSEMQPYPFGNWPQGGPEASQQKALEKVTDSKTEKTNTDGE